MRLTGQKKGWVKVNKGQTGFYRVKYAPVMMTGLSRAVESMELSPEDRLGLENDAFALARAGLLSTQHALNLATAYKNESDYTVWSDLSSGPYGVIRYCRLRKKTAH